jgi:hypothetical protein
MLNGECLVIMRSARIKETGGAYYHVISRVIERRMIMDQNSARLGIGTGVQREASTAHHAISRSPSVPNSD